jgi:hypothetical protein
VIDRIHIEQLEFYARVGGPDSERKSWSERATALEQGHRRMVLDRRRIHRRPLRAVALRDGILYVRVLQVSLDYELKRIAKTEILRKLKQRFRGKTIRDVWFRLG